MIHADARHGRSHAHNWAGTPPAPGEAHGERRATLKRSHVIVLLLLALVGFVPVGFTRPVTDHEARVILTARVMAQAGWPLRASPVPVVVGAAHGDPGTTLLVNPWLIPVYHGEIRLQKPPLTYWLTALLFRMSGSSDAGARLVPAVLGVVATLLIYTLALRLLRRRAAPAAALVWVSSHFVLGEFRHATADPYLAFFSLAALCAWVESSSVGRNLGPGRRPLWTVLIFYLLCAGGLLAKGPVLILHVLIPIVLLRLFLRRRSAAQPIAHALGLVLLLTIVLPWPLYVLRHVPGALTLWGQEVIGEGAVNPNPRPWYFYLPQVPLVVLPWILVWAAGVAQPFVRRDRRPRVACFAVAWAASTIVFFSFAHAKKNAYLLPSMPAHCLIVAQGFLAIIAAYRRSRGQHWTRAVPVIQGALGVGFALVTAALMFVSVRGPPLAVESTAIPYAQQFLVAAIALTAGCLPLFLRAWERWHQWFLVQSGSYAILLALFYDFPAAARSKRHEFSFRSSCDRPARLKVLKLSIDDDLQSFSFKKRRIEPRSHEGTEWFMRPEECRSRLRRARSCRVACALPQPRSFTLQLLVRFQFVRCDSMASHHAVRKTHRAESVQFTEGFRESVSRNIRNCPDLKNRLSAEIARFYRVIRHSVMHGWVANEALAERWRMSQQLCASAASVYSPRQQCASMKCRSG